MVIQDHLNLDGGLSFSTLDSWLDISPEPYSSISLDLEEGVEWVISVSVRILVTHPDGHTLHQALSTQISGANSPRSFTPSLTLKAEAGGLYTITPQLQIETSQGDAPTVLYSGYLNVVAMRVYS